MRSQKSAHLKALWERLGHAQPLGKIHRMRAGKLLQTPRIERLAEQEGIDSVIDAGIRLSWNDTIRSTAHWAFSLPQAARGAFGSDRCSDSLAGRVRYFATSVPVRSSKS